MKQINIFLSRLLLVFVALGFSLNSQAQTIYDVVAGSADHNTLEAAIDAAQLRTALEDSTATLTLFAPTDAAFAALGDLVNDLVTNNPTGDLADILRYHVLGMGVPSANVTNGLITTPLNTANTLKFTRRGADDVLFINQAQITVRDLPASNGVVHVIDAVVLPGETVVDVAIDNNFGTLTAAVVAAELLPALTDPAGTYTVFAPTDDAFAALGSTVTDLLMDPTGDLANILLYHVLGTEVPSAGVSNGAIVQPLSMTNTLKLTKRSADDSIFVNQAKVIGADVMAGNGTVHILDAVVLPGETVVDVAIDNGFGTLTTAVVAAELLPALTDPAGTYTVFAPTDDAFAALGSTVTDLLMDPTGDLANILLYHVLGTEVPSAGVSNGAIVQPLSMTNTLKLTKRSADDSIFVNQAKVIGADVMAGNGTVHILDAVVLPGETVVDVAIDNGFGTLTTAVVAAELLPALTDPAGTYTVFAPTDDAFAALGSTVTDLLMDPTGDLANILLYHVLGTEVPSAGVSNGAIVQPLSMTNTLKLTKRSADDSIFVNQAKVIGADVMAGNGTVHILDAVVLPGETVVDVAIDNGFGTLTTAVVAAELLPALTDPAGTYTVFAPTDDAFAALGSTVTDLLMDPTGDLANILLYHVLGTEVPSAGVSNGAIVQPLSMTNTLKLTKTSADGTIFVNQAQVTGGDVRAGNGIVHILNSVVLPGETVVDVAIDNGFNTLTAAVTAAELLPALTDPAGTYTVFAPTDGAFAELGDAVTTLLQDPTGDLQDILLYHVLGDTVASGAVASGVVQPLSMTNTLKLTKTSADGTIFVNQAQVTGGDVRAGNGIVHILNSVVLPGETVVDVAIDNGFNTLTAAVTAAELLPALTDPAGTYTVFAPTDSAFATLGDVVTTLLQDPTGDLQDILLYHVLGAEVASADVTSGVVQPLSMTNSLKLTKRSADDAVFVNQAQVAMADVTAGNGTVHVIDAVVLPVETVVDVAIDNNFNTLTTAVTVAELLPALTNPAGTFTVFAPTDSAFMALGDTLNDLLADPTGNLANTLLYHVLGSVVVSDSLMDGQIVETLFAGNVLSVDLSDGVKINDSPVILADVPAANGIVHVISKVLTPDFPTSTVELQLTPLQVFPNPTSDFVNINAVEKDYQYSIFDVTGAIQQNGNLLQGSNSIRLNNLSNGTYFMRIFNDKAFKTVRLVVNR